MLSVLTACGDTQDFTDKSRGVFWILVNVERAYNTTTSWQPAVRNPILGKAEIHIWRAPLTVSLKRVQSFAASFAADERTRAARFHFDRHRNQFIAGRGWLRTVVGWYLKTSPDSLNFTYSSYGKPALVEDFATFRLRFNLAHSGEFALYAFTLQRDIGVDIELIDPEVATEKIARQFFSANEVAALMEFPTDERARAFFDCWTRKEAFIKAQGMGLSLPLDEFEVSLKHDEPRVLNTRWNFAEATHWSIVNIDVAPEYAAALAAPADEYSLTYFHLDEASLVFD